VSDELLRVENLRTWFDTEAGTLRAVDGVSFSMSRGEVLGVVGESGSGKSVMARSILRLVQCPPGRYAEGRIVFEGEDLLEKSERQMRDVRGDRISMIFQEPMTSLNPVLTIGFQIAEALRLHRKLDWRAAGRESIELLRQVGIANPERRAGEYPHQLSGGMRQRGMIAMALAGRPALLIADEPTTALDVTIQAQILALLADLRATIGMSILLISHNLGVVSQMADRILIMYAGTTVESASSEQLFENPQHPYTRGLLASTPTVEHRRARLQAIEGNIPPLSQLPEGCRFHPRCPHAMPVCRSEAPPEVTVEQGHRARCWLLVEGRTT
jgi:oligopeptide/dipeptide ABC transporter ATP-binding protein